MAKKIILAGGSGFVGQALTDALGREGGWEIVLLTRDPATCNVLRYKPAEVRAVKWDAKTATGAWVAELEGAEAVVNFTGRSVNCVHTPENQRAILESRVDSVRALGAAMATLARPPATWIQCSAVGLYGSRDLPPVDEGAPAGQGFLADVCREWESTFQAQCPASVRPVVLRLGTVLGLGGGALPPLAKVARLGVGGHAGPGTQGMSWIHLDDLVAIFHRALVDPTLRGAFNAAAPDPVSNREFMRTLRQTVHRPWSPPAPAWAIRLVAPLVMKTDPSLVLDGQYCVPAALERAGFEFRFPGLSAALKTLLIHN